MGFCASVSRVIVMDAGNVLIDLFLLEDLCDGGVGSGKLREFAVPKNCDLTFIS